MESVEPEYVSASCEGERCSMCGKPAKRKVGEEILHDDPHPCRHNLTAYVCLEHFNQIMDRSGYTRPTPPADAMMREGCSGISYNGVQLWSDRETMKKLRQDLHEARTVPQLKKEILELRAALHPPAPVTDAQREALEKLELMRRRAHTHATISNSPRDMIDWIDRDAETIRTALTNPAQAQVDVEQERVIYSSDDDPRIKLSILQDEQGDVWLSLSEPSKGVISFRACTMQGGGKNLALRRALSDHLTPKTQEAEG